MAENSVTQKKQMKKIQELEFAMIETALYLDSHPNNKKALNYYNMLSAKRDEARAQYEAAYGPLTIFANKSENTWHWVETAWPWELEG